MGFWICHFWPCEITSSPLGQCAGGQRFLNRDFFIVPPSVHRCDWRHCIISDVCGSDCVGFKFLVDLFMCNLIMKKLYSTCGATYTGKNFAPFARTFIICWISEREMSQKCYGTACKCYIAYVLFMEFCRWSSISCLCYSYIACLVFLCILLYLNVFGLCLAYCPCIERMKMRLCYVWFIVPVLAI